MGLRDCLQITLYVDDLLSLFDGRAVAYFFNHNSVHQELQITTTGKRYYRLAFTWRSLSLLETSSRCWISLSLSKDCCRCWSIIHVLRATWKSSRVTIVVKHTSCTDMMLIRFIIAGSLRTPFWRLTDATADFFNVVIRGIPFHSSYRCAVMALAMPVAGSCWWFFLKFCNAQSLYCFEQFRRHMRSYRNCFAPLYASHCHLRSSLSRRWI